MSSDFHQALAAARAEGRAYRFRAERARAAADLEAARQRAAQPVTGLGRFLGEGRQDLDDVLEPTRQRIAREGGITKQLRDELGLP